MGNSVTASSGEWQGDSSPSTSTSERSAQVRAGARRGGPCLARSTWRQMDCNFFFQIGHQWRGGSNRIPREVVVEPGEGIQLCMLDLAEGESPDRRSDLRVDLNVLLARVRRDETKPKRPRVTKAASRDGPAPRAGAAPTSRGRSTGGRQHDQVEHRAETGGW